MAALLPAACALHIEAGELNVNGGSGDGLGNNANSGIYATYATADIGTFCGAGASASNYGTITTNGGSILTIANSQSISGQQARSETVLNGYGTLGVAQGAAAGDGWAEAGQTTGIDLYSGWGEASSYAGDQEYNGVNAFSSVSGIGTISTNQFSHASYGNLFSNQESTASIGLGGGARANSDAWYAAGHTSHVGLEISNSGGFWSDQGSGNSYGFISAGLNAEASNGEEGGSIYVSAESNEYWSPGGISPGIVDVNAYVQNGYIRASLFSQSDNYNALSGGNIDSAAGSYGWIGLNSYAYSGANSNKNAEFWNGYANSGVTAGTDGLSAWTAWEAPVDSLPSV